MAQHFWPKPLSKLFKKDVSRDVQMPQPVENANANASTPQRNLELARKCLDHVRKLTLVPNVSLASQLNRMQCENLVHKLQVAVESAEACAQFHPPEVTAECVESTKLLCRSAKEVESFIQRCSNSNLIQAAMELANVSELVSSLRFDLSFCALLFGSIHNSLSVSQLELAELELLSRSSVILTTRALRDHEALLSRLGALEHNSEHNSLSEEELQTSRRLVSRRLSQTLSGSVDVSVWEVDYQSLRQVQRLGKGELRKSIWMDRVEVAEKKFYGSNHPSFENEVRILAGLSHPNIVPLLGYTMDNNTCSIIMELMDRDLLLFMEQNHISKYPFTTLEGVDKMLQTAEGMLYLHEHKVVHRDLKSQNILVKSRKDMDAEYVYVKVADFGLSKTKESSSSYSNLTSNTGTTRWMAPELMSPGNELMSPGNDDPSARTYAELRYPFKVDVYSFGMVCLEILTGQVPFSSMSSLTDVKKMVLDGVRPELPHRCPHDLKVLISLCWEAQPERRPSFAKICRRLRNIKYLLMRGFNSKFLARQIPIEANARQVVHQDIALQIANGSIESSTLIDKRLGILDPDTQSGIYTSRASIGGLFVTVKTFTTQGCEQVFATTKLDHKNVLKVLGYRFEMGFRVVVYEYAALGSLDHLLHGKSASEVVLDSESSPSVLTWMQRVKIAVGVAKGLEYLHAQNPPIICGRIRSSDVMMFNDDVAKIGDITSTLGPFTLLPHTTDIRTPWALPCAPDFQALSDRTKSSIASNVFDLGVLLIELLTGRHINIRSELKPFLSRGFEEKVHKIVDQRLSPNYPAKAAAKMAAVAGLCVKHEPTLRPSPGLVLKHLEPLLTP